MPWAASYPRIPQDPDRDHSLPPSASADLNGQFDLLEWHPAYQSCQKFFLDHAQYDASVQAVASLVNISLPYQWLPTPLRSFMPEETAANSSRSTANANANQRGETQPDTPAATFATGRPQNIPTPPPYLTISPSKHQWVSLVPFIRRLVVTGFDREPVLHGFFGDDWRKGIGPVQECERRNYLFAAKSGGWTTVKTQYDMGTQETVPFLQPPQNMQLDEIENAEKLWSQWLALENWMVWFLFLAPLVAFPVDKCPGLMFSSFVECLDRSTRAGENGGLCSVTTELQYDFESPSLSLLSLCVAAFERIRASHCGRLMATANRTTNEPMNNEIFQFRW